MNKFLLIIFATILTGCITAWNGHPRYTFELGFMPNNEQYLVEMVKNFKNKHPEYDVFEYKNGERSLCQDYYFHNGAYNVYRISLYLPKNKCRVFMSIKSPQFADESVYRTIDLISYEVPIYDTTTNNVRWGNANLLWNGDHSNIYKSINDEVDEIMSQIGDYEKD